MSSKLLPLIWTLLLIGISPKMGRVYQKDYYQSGTLRSEGWQNGQNKVGYWKFYHENGVKSEQGHYLRDQRENYWHFYDPRGRLLKQGHYHKGKEVDWWLFYDARGKVNHKCQLKDGIKNGYCLKYMNEKLTSAEKYSNGRKIKEWFSFRSFQRENKLSDLK
ncbi:hypothetical protein WIW50_08825 [Flavobacteriaceae bacterium 3-367]|uniref:toxin-antitoxin system YwqK family antitoxin n=1 Tax=Eudoraea algarum TaxID=3417568 RepID=UPI00327F7D10